MIELQEPQIVRLAVALGIGLLIGIERERAKAHTADTEAAGVRTFALTGLAGGVSLMAGGVPVFAVAAAVVGVLVAFGYYRTHAHDPGLTTEVAQLLTFLLGGLALREPQVAAALGVVVAILLAARSRLHAWVRHSLTSEESRDALTLAAAALVILPLTPDGPIDPWGVINPRQLWALAVTVMAINAAGYIALRALGPKSGLVLAGLFSGFVSSTATIGAMGARAKRHPELRRSAVAGGAISSVATVIQLAVLIGLVDPALLRELAVPLLAAGLMVAAYAGLFTIRSVREHDDRAPPAGRPFDPRLALIFVAVVGLALLAAALLTEWLGDRGLLIASAVAGLADAHAPAISAASLAAGGGIAQGVAGMAVLAAFTSNALSKIVVAFTVGDGRFAAELAPGIALSVAAGWGAFVALG